MDSIGVMPKGARKRTLMKMVCATACVCIVVLPGSMVGAETVDTARARVDAIQARITVLTSTVAELEADQHSVDDELGTLSTGQMQVASEIARSEKHLKQLAVRAYTSGVGEQELGDLFDSYDRDLLTATHRKVLSGRGMDRIWDAIDHLHRLKDGASPRINELTVRAEQLADRLSRARNSLAAAREALDTANRHLQEAIASEQSQPNETTSTTRIDRSSTSGSAPDSLNAQSTSSAATAESTLPATTTVQTRPSTTLPAPPPGGPTEAQWAALRQCESSGNYSIVSSDGRFRGAYQFDYGTWRSVGGSGDPAAASPAEQDLRAKILYSRRGAEPWPVCGRYLR